MRVKTHPVIVEKEEYWSSALSKLKRDIENTSIDECGDEKLKNLLADVNQNIFEDQPNLNDWVTVLDRIDIALDTARKQDAMLDLTEISKRNQILDHSCKNSIPLVLACLRFSALLLQNSVNKAVYNSTEHLLAFFASADDSIVEWSLRCTACMEMPVSQHKQIRGDVSSSLFPSLDVKTASKKFAVLSQGWGYRGQGLGIFDCICGPDESLPQYPGTLTFTFKRKEEQHENVFMKTVYIEEHDVHLTNVALHVHFIQIVNKYDVPEDQHFSLLSRLRLARSFKNRETRRRAVTRRILSIINLVLCHTCEESLASYLQSQPELVQELVDLVRARMIRQESSGTVVLSGIVPHDICVLAIHTLSALAAAGNEDGGGGPRGSQGSIARSTNIFMELGVSRGQFSGLLPTLIRNCVASLCGGFETSQHPPVELQDGKKSMDPDLFIGFAFVQAVRGGNIPAIQLMQENAIDMKHEYIEKLERIESLFGLVEVIVGTQGGASALTDCGLIAAMLRVIQLIGELKSVSEEKHPFQLNYVLSQCIHIVEAASSNHSSALSIFRELNGESLLVNSFHVEVTSLVQASSMDLDKRQIEKPSPSKSAVIYALLTELNTALVHSQGVPHNLGSQHLCAGILTEALLVIIRNSEIFSAQIITLVVVSVFEIANSDPTCVSYIHSSTLADALVDMMAKPIPLSSELIMTIPNLIGALALTEDGVNRLTPRISELFPHLLFIFCCESYITPHSRCIHGDVANTFGNGLDELMRHAPSFKKEILKSIIEILVYLEKECSTTIDSKRETAQQYIRNVTCLLEPILSKPEHAQSFIDMKGQTLLLKLLPYTLPSAENFISNISCVSTTDTQSLMHYPAAHAFTDTIKTLGSNQGANTMIALIESLKTYLCNLKDKAVHLKICLKMINVTQTNESIPLSPLKKFEKKEKIYDLMSALGIDDDDDDDNEITTLISESDLNEMTVDLQGTLGNIPSIPIYIFEAQSSVINAWRDVLASYINMLMEIICVDWHISAMTSVLRTVHTHIGQDKMWASAFLKGPGKQIVSCLSTLQLTAELDVCRMEKFFIEQDVKYDKEGGYYLPDSFDLHIICPNGAVVRTGIEIDTCDQVHMLECGTKITAFERQVSTSGVMRYRTSHGWISEHMRGGSQSPIAEVLSMTISPETVGKPITADSEKKANKKTRVRCLRGAGHTVFNRIHASMLSFFSALGKTMQGAGRSVLRDDTVVGLNYQAFLAAELLAQFISHFVSTASLLEENAEDGPENSESVYEFTSHFLVSTFELISATLFDERRHTTNVFVLYIFEELGVLNMILNICDYSLSLSLRDDELPIPMLLNQSPRLSLTILKRLAIRSRIINSPMIRALTPKRNEDTQRPSPFNAEIFTRQLHLNVAKILWDNWNSYALCLLHPIEIGGFFNAIIELIISLKIECNIGNSLSRSISAAINPTENQLHWNILGARPRELGILSGPRDRDLSESLHHALSMLGEQEGHVVPIRNRTFSPSEASINQLVEMGFSRSRSIRALHAVESNRVEIAMEYLLSDSNRAQISADGGRNDVNSTPQDEADNMRNDDDGDDDNVDADDNENNNTNEGTESGGTLGQEAEASLQRPETRMNGLTLASNEETEKSDSNILELTMKAKTCLKEFLNCSQDKCFEAVKEVSVDRVDLEYKEPEIIDAGFNIMVADFLSDLTYHSVEVEISEKHPSNTPSFEAVMKYINKKQIDQMRDLMKISATTKDSEYAGLFHLLLILIHYSGMHARSVVSEKDFVDNILTRMENVIENMKKEEKKTEVKWPAFFSPGFLILDILAQEVAEKSPTDDISSEVVFPASIASKRCEPGNDICESACLLSAEQMNRIMSILTGCFIESFSPKARQPQPGCLIVQAALKLLSRMTRTYAYAQQFIQHGGVPVLLTLPSTCRYDGHTTIATTICLHLMEESATLQLAMEAGIKAAFIKLSKQRQRPAFLSQSTQSAIDGVQLHHLMPLLAPMAARNRKVFLKALHSTLVLKADRSSSPDRRLVMLKQSAQTNQTTVTVQNLATPAVSSVPASSTKNFCKSKEKAKVKAKRREYEPVSKDYVINMLLAELLYRSSQNTDMKDRVGRNIMESHNDPEDKMCFSVADLLDIITNLVLSFPSCAIALHRFGSHEKHYSTDISNVISGSMPILQGIKNAIPNGLQPQPTVVAFLLHSVLPLPRSAVSGESATLKERQSCRKALAHRMRITQNCAKLLVALCARAGEGRRRVIVELQNCLQCSPGSNASPEYFCGEQSFWSIQSWGELVFGLAAPKAAGVQLPDSSSLSFEIIRVMADTQMVETLISALTRIDLRGFRSVPTSAALLRPLEMLTRKSVRIQIMKKSKNQDMPEKKSTLPSVPVSAPEVENTQPEELLRSVSRHSRRNQASTGRDVNRVDSTDMSFINDDTLLSEAFEPQVENHDIDILMSGSDISRGMSIERSDSVLGGSDDESLNDPGFHRMRRMSVESSQDDESSSRGYTESSSSMDEESNHSHSIDDSLEDNENENVLGLMGSEYGDEDDDEEDRDDDPEDDDFEDDDDEDDEEGNHHDDEAAWNLQDDIFFGVSNRRTNRSDAEQNEANESYDVDIFDDDVRDRDDFDAENDSISQTHYMVDPIRLSLDPSGRQPILTTEHVLDLAMNGRSRRGGTIPRISQLHNHTRQTSNDYVRVLYTHPTRPTAAHLPHLGTTYRLFSDPPISSSQSQQNTASYIHPLLQHIVCRGARGVNRRNQRYLGFSRVGGSAGEIQSLFNILDEPLNFEPLRSNNAVIAVGGNNATSENDTNLNETRWTDDGQPMEWSMRNLIATNLLQPVLELLDESNISDDHEKVEERLDSSANVFQEPESNTLPVESVTVETYETLAESMNSPPIDSRAATLSSSTRHVDSTDNPSVSATELQEVTGAENNIASGSLSRTADDQALSSPLLNMDVVISSQSGNRETINNDQIESVSNSQEVAEPVTQNRCPPGVDEEVFAWLPEDVQQELIRNHEQTVNAEAAGLDVEALEALPPELREEVLNNALRRQRLEADRRTPADPSRALDMDNASFVASLSSELRAEILMQADDELLRTLPPNLIAEALMLQERQPQDFLRGQGFRSSRNQENTTISRTADRTTGVRAELIDNQQNNVSSSSQAQSQMLPSENANDTEGKIKLEPDDEYSLPSIALRTLIASLINLIHLRSPVRPHKLLLRLLMNVCSSGAPARLAVTNALIALAASDRNRVRNSLKHFFPIDESANLQMTSKNKKSSKTARSSSKRLHGGESKQYICATGSSEVESSDDEYHEARVVSSNLKNLFIDEAATIHFPPAGLIGGVQDPVSFSQNMKFEVDPVVARRVLNILTFLAGCSNRILCSILSDYVGTVPAQKALDDRKGSVGINAVDKEGKELLLERLFCLLDRPIYNMNSLCLDQLLQLLEVLVVPLKAIPEVDKVDMEVENNVASSDQVEAESSAAHLEECQTQNIEESARKSDSALDVDPLRSSSHDYVPIPTPTINKSQLRLLCTVLRLESCSDASMARITNVLTCLSRVPSNKTPLLHELQRVAKLLGLSGAAELNTLSNRLQQQSTSNSSAALSGASGSSEVKLLRVLQTLTVLTGNDVALLEELLGTLNLETLWESLSCCLQIASQVHGVLDTCESDETNGTLGDDDAATSARPAENEIAGRSKQSSAMAGLLARFLPIIKAFFLIHGRDLSSETTSTNSSGPGGESQAESQLTTVAESPIDVQSAQFSLPRNTADLFNNLPGARFRKNVPKNMRMNVEKDNSEVSPKRMILSSFVSKHRALLNALLHQNPTLLDKSLGAMIQDPKCRQHLDFANKRSYFRVQLRKMRQHSTRRYGSLHIAAPRSDIFERSYQILRLRTADEMRGRLYITFEGEEGVDAGGLTREWYNILAQKIFDPNYALFKAGADGVTFQPNALSGINPDHLQYFTFVGRIVGKAIADGQLLDAHFTHSFYKHILGVPVKYTDMEAIDPTYYKNLVQMLSLPLEQLGLEELTFSTDTANFGQQVTIDLIPNGRNIHVNDSNKLEYVQRIAHYRMTDAIRPQIEAFLEGFHDLVPPELISIFTPSELELLISGMPNVDLDDLQANTTYRGYKPSDSQIQYFWNVLKGMTNEERALFLQFVTGSSKVPLEGFSHLQGMRGIQRFSIHRAYGGAHLLPSAHTCFNQLDLPEYESEDQLRARLMLAIKEGSTGFGFA